MRNLSQKFAKTLNELNTTVMENIFEMTFSVNLARVQNTLNLSIVKVNEYDEKYDEKCFRILDPKL